MTHLHFIIFFALAALFNSIMDTLKDHYWVSIFSNLNQFFWNPSVSWKKKILGYVAMDAWHICKSAMLGCIYFTIITYKPVFGYWDLLLLPTIWGIVFELFYSHILTNDKFKIK